MVRSYIKQTVYTVFIKGFLNFDNPVGTLPIIVKILKAPCIVKCYGRFGLIFLVFIDDLIISAGAVILQAVADATVYETLGLN